MSQTPQDKHDYHTPEFRDYGTVSELTQGSSSNSNSTPDNPTSPDHLSTSINAPAADGLGGYITG
ncbi:MAG: lasso RiPP family leader peptide-containing protein [Anaerolineales bacterium]